MQVSYVLQIAPPLLQVGFKSFIEGTRKHAIRLAKIAEKSHAPPVKS
ncbi:MAG: hypothetical protein ACLPY5_04760 [Candidatus Bathyarchaeia archaeon]